MNTLLNKIIIILMLGSTAATYAHAETHGTEVESLSPELRTLLQKEMQALQKGMMDIIPAYIAGNWGEIKVIAHQMKNSYIMKQQLTDAQKKELHSTLPDSFIELDQQFHYLAGMLEHVAEEEKLELINFYFSKMGETCMSCHAQFATHKFPAFRHETEEHKHTH